MIRLKSISLNNFLSHKSTNINLDNYEGLVLIEGINEDGHYSSNGSGKSTILEGIVYALTGDTLRGVGVNDVVNRNYKKDTKVSLEFSIDDVEYIVTRYRKDTKFGDNLVLLSNGENISKRLNKDTQKELENILGISYKLLASTVLLGEGLSSRFTQLSDPEKKSLIESTLNLTFDMSKVRDSANSKLKSAKQEEATISGELNVISSLSAVDVADLEGAIDDTRDSIKIYSSTADSLKEEYDRVYREVQSISPKLQVISGAINKYDTLLRDYDNLLKSNEHYESERDRVVKGENTVCAMCHQVLSSLASKQSLIDHYNSAIKDNLDSMNRIKEEIGKLPDRRILDEKYNSLSAELRENNELSQKLMQDYNSCRVKEAQSKKDLEKLQSDYENIQDMSDKKAEKEKERDHLLEDIRKYEYFYNLFSPTGIIVNILSDAIEYINDRLRAYSSVLIDKDYHLEFVKGKISLIDDKKSSYQSLSNGEKRRIDIAIQFSLHDYINNYCGMRLDCCFIDEILDTLDDIGIDNIFDVLRMKLDYCGLKSIYVITHNDSLKDKFDRVITVRKDKKGDSFVS